MDIKEDVGIKNGFLVDNFEENVPNETQQCLNPNVMLKEEIGLTGVGSACIKHKIYTKPIALLDSTNRVFLHEDQHLKINVISETIFADISKKKITCKLCNINFAIKADFKSHFANEHPLNCDICLVKLKNKPSLKRHSAIHSDKYDFECQICNKKFKRRDTLKEHLMTHSHRYNFKCNICNLRLRYKPGLRKHLLTHSATCAFECHFCQKTFKRKDSMLRHLTKKYKCKVCDFKCPCRAGLKAHSVTHETMFDCVICHAKLRRKQSLKHHLERHLYIYDFECNICCRKFKREEQHKEHLEMHAAGAFECRFCRAPFSRKDSLETHIRNLHSIKRIKEEINKKKLVIVLHDCLQK